MKIIYFLSFLLSSVHNDVYAKRCRSGFHRIHKACYWISPTKFTANWIDAREYCKAMNAYLLIVTSSSENSAIHRALRKFHTGQNHYIGASDMQKEGHFMWMSRGRPEAVRYFNFEKHEPNNHGGREDCLEMWKSGKWNDLPCHRTNGFICKYSP